MKENDTLLIKILMNIDTAAKKIWLLGIVLLYENGIHTRKHIQIIKLNF